MAQQQPAPVQPADLVLVACDASGVLYGAVAGSSDLAGTIAVCDVRNTLLEQQASQVPCQTLADLHVETIVHPQPALPFIPTSMAVSPSGQYLAVCGTDPEEEGQAAVVVIDLHGGEPTHPASSAVGLLRTPGVRGTGRRDARSPRAKGGPPAVRHKQCAAHAVDYRLFASRPGLTVRQMLWHPHCEGCLLLLTSDSRLRLYTPGQLQAPHLTLHLQCSSSGAVPAGGTRYGLSACTAGEEAVACAWGSEVGWGPFTLYVLSSVGGLYAVCPLAPPGMRVSASSLLSLLHHARAESAVDGGDSAADVQAWLQAAFGVDHVEDLGVEPSWTVVPHALDGMSPALQGPLNRGSASLLPTATESVSLAALHHELLPSSAALGGSLGARSPGGPEDGPRLTATTALLSGSRNGHLWAHVLVDAVQGVWDVATPRVDLTPAGAVRSVRYECTAWPPQDATAVLLDAIDLQLGGTHGGDADDGTGDDDEGDAAYGSTARAPLPLQLTALSAAGSHSVLVCHAAGAWAVGVDWLPAAAQQLALPGGSVSMAFGSGTSVLAAPTVQELLSCAPGAGDSTPGGAAHALLSGAGVQDVLVGRAAFLLQRPGVLHCVRPGAALALAAAAEQAASGGLGAGEVDEAGRPVAPATPAPATGSAPSSPKASSSKEVVKAALQAVYADLVQPPAAPPLPTLQGDITAAGGATYLTAAIRALRQGGVEVAHRTHAALTQRAGQLDKEAQTHQASVGELRSLLTQLEERQRALDERAQRAAQLHANLTERAALLSQLHWSLPRPLSQAEKQLSADLGVMATRQAALESSWDAMHRRAQQLLSQAKHRQQPAAGTGAGVRGPGATAGPGRRLALPGSVRLPGVRYWGGDRGAAGQAAQSTAGAGLRVPDAQMQAVHASLMEHMAAISSAAAELEGMQRAAKAWAEDNDAAAAKGA